MKIHEYGAKTFNETCSFELTIGLVPLILIILETKLLFSITHFNFHSILAEPQKHILVTTAFLDSFLFGPFNCILVKETYIFHFILPEL